jgi:hypothetical protein
MMTVTWRTTLSALLICASGVAGVAGQSEKTAGHRRRSDSAVGSH